MNKKAGAISWVFIVVLLTFLWACQKEESIPEPDDFPDIMEMPKGFPELTFPEGNEFSMARWALGKKLFFEPALSADSSISCASCHRPRLAFSDDLPVSPGVEQRPGTRNSPTLANIGYNPYFMREGGVPTLEMQVLVPIQEHNEFGFNVVLIAERLNQNPTYLKMAREAYDRDSVDAFVITRALACFERSLLSGNSSYDQYVHQGVKEALSPAAKRGMELFFSERTNCSTCHNGINFSNYAFENNGLYEEYEDVGRFRATKKESDRASFKVPVLRNVALTAPYMHDGSLNTLEEVVEHYQTGGTNHPNKSPLIQPLDLTETEKKDLIEFLKSLTDHQFVNNPVFQQ